MGKFALVAFLAAALFGAPLAAPGATDVVLGPSARSAAVRGALPAPRPNHSVVVRAEFIAPVNAVVIDPFRAPPEPWLAGNRGLEYDTTVGQSVVATAAGVVTFAGQVGGNLFITIRHGPDLVTTVGYLETVGVASGATVAQGEVIATAGDTLHFSARRNGAYIDPASLMQSVRIHVRLVPVPS